MSCIIKSTLHFLHNMQCYIQHEDVEVFNSYGCVRNFHKISNILDIVRLEAYIASLNKYFTLHP